MDIPKNNLVSVFKGFWFVFTEGENRIVAGGSAFSGKEYVYLNDVLVSEKRSMKKRTEHEFQIANKTYKIVINVPEIMKGKIECLLYCDNTLIKGYRANYRMKFNHKAIIKAFILCIAISFSYGLLCQLYNFPYWDIMPFILLPLFFFIGGFNLKNRFEIEEFSE